MDANEKLTKTITLSPAAWEWLSNVVDLAARAGGFDEAEDALIAEVESKF